MPERKLALTRGYRGCVSVFVGLRLVYECGNSWCGQDGSKINLEPGFKENVIQWSR